jgi:hypothetical protein
MRLCVMPSNEGKNLISYVEANKVEEVRKNPANGTVKDVNELRRHLGMPTEAVDFMAPLIKAHAPSPRAESEHGAVLSRLYDDLDALIRARRNPALKIGPIEARETIRRNCDKRSPDYYGDHIAPRMLARGELTFKSLGSLVKLRDEIGRAATFSVIPQMVTEEYLQANARLHGQDLDKNNQPLSKWAKQQNYTIRTPEPIVKPAKPEGGKPTPEQILESQRLKKLKNTEVAEETEEELIGDWLF